MPNVLTTDNLAGPEFPSGQYEFQCLHGMGEPLYAEVVGAEQLNRPCRIYAPVGTHETLLAYLVRRLLENGANSSFVNRIANPAVSIEELTADPVAVVRAMPEPGAPHDAIRLPEALFDDRINSAGLDLASETVLADLAKLLTQGNSPLGRSAPIIPGLQIERPLRAVRNPADARDQVGEVAFVLERDAVFAAREAMAATAPWAATPVAVRAACLERAAAMLEERMPLLLGLIVREAGKSVPNAIAEVREAVDFLRYYATQARALLTEASLPLGPVVCISPWNFPLAIFIGQIAAALVAGNAVLAKPAEETPLIAAEGVRILHEAGVPHSVLQFLPGEGTIGAALVAAPETAGVMFTGSTEVARLIQRQLAGRLSPQGQPIPLIAETGGLNAMIVDSSALAEQVVADVIASAFDSAGQRCSALRILCLQEEIADRTLTMLKGALGELRIGRPDRLAVDIGPVITPEARAGILDHVEAMRALGVAVEQQALPPETRHGHFVPPTIIELHRIEQLEREIFGPVLHVVRFRRDDLGALIDRINATGYGLTFGLHTRIVETIAFVTGRIGAGNIYVNRNVIGAVVGVQPFGGHGLSGTGPKAGGPLYLRRLVQCCDAPLPAAPGQEMELPGPVGERNLYALHPRGLVELRPKTEAGLLGQLDAALGAGNRVRIVAPPALLAAVPAEVRGFIVTEGVPAAVLIEGEGEEIIPATREIAERPGPIAIVQAGTGNWRRDLLVSEVSTSINTAAAGGNASLMAMT